MHSFKILVIKVEGTNKYGALWIVKEGSNGKLYKRYKCIECNERCQNRFAWCVTCVNMKFPLD